MSIVSIIAAVAQNNIIGKDNDLIWHYPSDMKYFKEKTKGHPIIMGRRNYDSIPDKYRPLPDRTNIIVTRNENFKDEGIEVCHTLEKAIERACEINKEEVFIIGGGEIYKYAIEHNLCDRLYITEIHQAYKGDTYFPEFDKFKWLERSRIKNKADERHKSDFDFVIYERT